jgi:hypothetical protein
MLIGLFLWAAARAAPIILGRAQSISELFQLVFRSLALLKRAKSVALDRL